MKKFRNLSLVMAGFVLGISVAFAPQLQAAASKLLGSKVTTVLDVEIDNKSIGDGPVINGTTYVPLRTAATEMGLEVKSVDSSKVKLSSNTDEPQQNTTVPVNDNKAQQEMAEMKAKTDKINNLTTQISQLKIKIKNLQNVVDSASTESTDRIKLKIENLEKYVSTQPLVKTELDSYKTQLKKINDAATEAQKQIDELKPQLSDLESQLAELQK